MNQPTKRDKLKALLNGNASPAELLPDAIVILKDENGQPVDPETMEPIHPAIIKNAKFSVTLPMNGREGGKK
jgi:hypothetical protein